MPRLVSLVQRHARPLLALGVLLLAVGALVGHSVAGRPSDPEADLQDPSAPSLAARGTVQGVTGAAARDGLFALVLTAADARSDPGAQVAVEQAARTLEADRSVQAVHRPTLSGPGVSADGRASQITASLEPGADVAAAADRLRDLLGPDVHVGGPAVLSAELDQQVTRDVRRAELLALVILLVLALAALRSWAAAAVVPGAALVALAATASVLAGLNAVVIRLSPGAVDIGGALALVLGGLLALGLTGRVRDELGAGGTPADAVAHVLPGAARGIVAGSLAFSASFAALLVLPMRVAWSAGVGGITAALASGLVALAIVPAALVLLGGRLRPPRPGRAAAGRPPGARLAGVADAIGRRPGVAVAVTAGVLVLAGLPLTRATPIAADARQLPAGAPARQAADLLELRLPAAAAEPLDIVGVAPASQADDVADFARTLRAAVAPLAVTGPERLDSATWRLRVPLPDGGTSAADRRLVHRVRALPAAFPVQVGGPTAAFVDQRATLAAKLPVALGVLVVLSFALLFAITGSVVLPIAAIVLSSLTVAATFGVLVLVFQNGVGDGVTGLGATGGVELTQPLVLGAIAFGLATAQAAVLLVGIEGHRRAGLPEPEAVARALAGTGRAVTYAAVGFGAGLGVLATSGALLLREVGLGTALAALIDGALVRSVLVPAGLARLGRWAWWAPRPLRRLHHRLLFPGPSV